MAHRPELRNVVAVPTGAPRLAASDLDGWTLEGRRRTLRLTSPGDWTLLLFLGSHCDGCLPFWRVPRAPTSCGLEPEDAAVVVTKDPQDEDPDVLAGLLDGDPGSASRHLLLSGDAWRAYRVHGAPFFVLVDGVQVATEGVAWSLEQVAADVGRARRQGGAETAREAQGRPRVRR